MSLNKYLYVGMVICIVFLWSCQKETTTNSLQDEELEKVLAEVSNGAGKAFFQLPESDDFAKIPQDPKNPITAEKVKLGQLLYHETGIALSPENPISTGNYSCASCHFASAGFQAGRFQGIAEGGIGFGQNGEGRIRGSLYPGDMLDVQPIRSPSAMNIAYQTNVLWNGQFGATGVNVGTEDAWKEDTPIATNHLGYEGTEIQAIAGLKVHRLEMDSSFLRDNDYLTYCEKAFPDVAAPNHFDREHGGLAIAAYERTLLSNQAPFQNWLRGDKNALTEKQKEGAIIFFGKGKCATCHTGPALSSMEFHALGMKDLYQINEITFKTNAENTENLGRGGFTGKDEDLYKFKVPQLYNLKDSPFYGHGSSFRSIRAVLEYKNKGVKENENVPDNALSPLFKPKGLSDAEIDALVSFIEDGLYDPNLKRYEPSSVLSGNCFPFNDPMAKSHLGCD